MIFFNFHIINIYSKTTFVTVNLSAPILLPPTLSNSKTTFVTVNQNVKCYRCYYKIDSKTTFVTVNPSFLKALYFII